MALRNVSFENNACHSTMSQHLLKESPTNFRGSHLIREANTVSSSEVALKTPTRDKRLSMVTVRNIMRMGRARQAFSQSRDSSTDNEEKLVYEYHFYRIIFSIIFIFLIDTCSMKRLLLKLNCKTWTNYREVPVWLNLVIVAMFFNLTKEFCK